MLQVSLQSAGAASRLLQGVPVRPTDCAGQAGGANDWQVAFHLAQAFKRQVSR